jgi:hypothetical protein
MREVPIEGRRSQGRLAPERDVFIGPKTDAGHPKPAYVSPSRVRRALGPGPTASHDDSVESRHRALPSGGVRR